MFCTLKQVVGGMVLSVVLMAPAWALPLSDYNKLKDVTVERSDGDLHIQLHFKKAPSNHTPPVFFKKSIQVDLPYTYLAPAKQYFPTQNTEIKQVYASQYDSEKLRVRFILGERGKNLVDRFQMQRIGNILDIWVKPVGSAPNTNKEVPVVSPVKKKSSDPLDGLFERANEIQKTQDQAMESEVKPEKHAKQLLQLFDEPKPAQETKTNPTSNEKPESTSLSKAVGSALQKKNGKSLSQVLNGGNPESKNKSTQGSVAEGQGPDLVSTGMKMFSMLVLVLGVMLLIFYLFKKFVWKNSVFGGGSKPIKVLSTGFLGPKKSIALVEVAGEVLVLGISNDNISLLGNVEEPGRIDLIKGMEGADVAKGKGMFANKEVTSTRFSSAAKASEAVAAPGKVDAYQSIIKKKKADQGFSEMVQKFDDSHEDAPPTMEELSDRLNQKLKTTERVV